MSDVSGTQLATVPADADGASAPKSKLMPTIAAVGLLTLVAIGGGAGVGFLLGGAAPSPPPATEAAAEVEPTDGKKEVASAEPSPTAKSQILKLEPVVTNVTSPADVLMRVEASIVIDPEKVDNPALLAAEIQGDTLAFLRTIDLAQVEGSRGLLHLREDLRERAQQRSAAVSDYLIQALIAQ
jgi:flagellar FliL protein